MKLNPQIFIVHRLSFEHGSLEFHASSQSAFISTFLGATPVLICSPLSSFMCFKISYSWSYTECSLSCEPAFTHILCFWFHVSACVSNPLFYCWVVFQWVNRSVCLCITRGLLFFFFLMCILCQVYMWQISSPILGFFSIFEWMKSFKEKKS